MTDVSSLIAVFDASTVHRLTTDRVIRGGEKFHSFGAVTIKGLTPTVVSGRVQGTRHYEVRLDVMTHSDWSCTCPAAIDGDFCTHCVAVAVELAAIDTPLRMHDLRHTATSLWIAAGANPKQIAVRAGHTSVSVVLDRYGHLLPQHDDALLLGLEYPPSSTGRSDARARTTPMNLTNYPKSLNIDRFVMFYEELHTSKHARSRPR